MSYKTQNYSAIISGGLGNPEAWDIITDSAHDLDGKTVIAFTSNDAAGGTFDAMEEETTFPSPNKDGVSTAVAAKYLTYTYLKDRIYPGRYTLLTPSEGCSFMVWFLK